jgi:glycerol-3-phosphate acyltransferase PlsX
VSAAPLTIAVDAGGADLGAAEVARGAARAAQEHGVRVLLFGDGDLAAPSPDVQVIDAPRSIAKDPDPVRAVRAHPDASVVQAVQAVAEDRAAGLVSGGSTGPALAAAIFRIKRASGIHRPALAIPVPAFEHPFLLLDVGANVDVRPEQLVQFAHMGAAYAQLVLGVERPRVALLSNGEEPSKGTPDVVEAHERLAGEAGTGLNFVGNVEGLSLLAGGADVVVCDGFTGNVALKVMEGTSATVMGAVRRVATASARGKAGGLLLRPALREMRDSIDPEAHGGAVLLGLRKPVVVPHGSFGERGIAAAIGIAARAAREDLTGRTHTALSAGGALRRRPEASAAPGSVSDRP